MHVCTKRVCSLMWWQQTWAALMQTSLNPTWGHWWKRVHLALSTWVTAAGCASAILSFLSTAFTILKPMAELLCRFSSVIRALQRVRCHMVWEKGSYVLQSRPGSTKGWGWQLLEYRCTGLSWLQALPGMLCFHVISASPGCRLSLSLCSLHISCAGLYHPIQGQ